MFELLGLALATGLVAAGYTYSRHFVRQRLRYVDAVLSGNAPLIAAAATAVVAVPACALMPLPFFTAFTGVFVALGVGAGVKLGARDIRDPAGYIERR